VNLRPGGGWPGTADVAAGLARVAAVPGRIAGDAVELARARRAGELAIAAVCPAVVLSAGGGWPGRTSTWARSPAPRRMPGSTPAQMGRARDGWQAGQYRGGAGQQSACTGNPCRGR